jgi:hypothetical protein
VKVIKIGGKKSNIINSQGLLAKVGRTVVPSLNIYLYSLIIGLY